MVLPRNTTLVLSNNIFNKRVMSKNKEERKLNLLYIILLILLLLSISLSNKAQTYTEVKNYLDSIGVQQVDIVMRQVAEETGYLKCTGCSRDRNNLFGWYYKKKYLSFDTWQGSCDYLKGWQERHYKGGDYYEFLKKRGYATNPKYISNLKRIRLDRFN